MAAPKISICVVAKNAARTYERLFSSLREFADRGGDMVLVDTGSTDGTPTIYRAFGFRVFEVGDKFRIPIPDEAREAVNASAVECGDPPFIDEGASLFSFADARNFAAAQALNDYIINPDADEAMSAFDIDKCEEYFATYSRFRYDFVFDHHADGSPNLEFVTDTRCSDRRYWRWKGHVHETNEAIAPNATMGYVPPDVFKIEHWQIPSPTRSNYLPGLAYACWKEPANDRNSHYYGRELMYRRYWRSAIRELERHLTISTWDMERGQSMVFIGDCHMGLGEHDKAVEWYHRAFHTYPRREPLVQIANYWKWRNEPARVVPYVAAALEVPRSGFYGDSPSCYQDVPHRLMYWAMGWTGRVDEARKHILKALEFAPDDAEMLSHLWYYFPKPKVSVILPSVRPAMLDAAVERIMANAGYDNFEIVVERDDPAAPSGAIATFNRAVEKSTGDLVLCMGDDSHPQPNYMVKALVSMFRHFPALDGMIAFNDLYWDEETSAHWMASKQLLPALGGVFFHPGYYHLYSDNELADRVRALGKFYWDKDVKVRHLHPTTEGNGSDAEKDAHYRRTYDPERCQHDWVLYQERMRELGIEPHIPKYTTRQTS